MTAHRTAAMGERERAERGQRAVLGLLRREAGPGGVVTIDQATIAASLGWRRRDNVRRSVRALEAQGQIHVQFNGNQRRPDGSLVGCTYTLREAT